MAIDQLLTILVLLAGFYMSWNIGANDVANAMGTSVGSGALTLFKATAIAGVLEFCGAFFLGDNVSKTLEQNLVNYPEIFAHHPQNLLYGMLSSLIATAVWVQIASYFGWPVSTTHAIIGALLGLGASIGGVDSIHWSEVGRVTTSWVVSPAVSGLLSFAIFTILQKQILYAVHPIRATKRLIPILSFALFTLFTLTVLLNGIGSLQIALSLPHTLCIAIGMGMLAASIAHLFLKKARSLQKFALTPPHLAHQIHSLNKALKHLKRVEITSTGEEKIAIHKLVNDLRGYAEEIRAQPNFYPTSSHISIVEKMFASLQLLSASYVAFAHGANDVANAIGPVSITLDLIKRGAVSSQSHTPLWLLAMGGIGIVIGLATWGWRVIETIGKKITELTPTRGFSAEFGAAITILIASKWGLPISTTHCIVGSILGIGLAKGLIAINLKTIRDVILSWVITLPASAVLCILIFHIARASTS